MTNVVPLPPESIEEGLNGLLHIQKSAFLANPMPSAKERVRRLDLLHNAVLAYKEQLIDAVNEDFSNRSVAETQLAEIYPVLDGIAYARKRVAKWMKARRRHAPQVLQPATVKVVYQPLGVIGIVVPWNFPIFLGLSPLIMALAAGNRAMIKTSEFAPKTSEVIKQMLGSCFDESEVAVVEGEVEVSSAFTSLHFDHLVFTGATSVGRIVMKAAAENLTPVTLELGGKSPTIIHDSFPIDVAAERLVFGKSMNAGQICVSPDYLFCPRDKVNEFVNAFQAQMTKRYASLKTNEDYTSIINDRQLKRLQKYVDDAEQKGARLITINPQNESFEGTRKFPMTLVLDPSDDMLVLQEEIFGPILPIIAYDSIDETIDYVNARPRPLALYYFDWDEDRAREILEKTHSGGVSINDSLSQVMADDIPFGGIGDSGMGNYHGHEGFLQFSKAKGVVSKGRINSTSFVGAPWDRAIFNSLMFMQDLRFRERKIDRS